MFVKINENEVINTNNIEYISYIPKGDNNQNMVIIKFISGSKMEYFNEKTVETLKNLMFELLDNKKSIKLPKVDMFTQIGKRFKTDIDIHKSDIHESDIVPVLPKKE